MSPLIDPSMLPEKVPARVATPAPPTRVAPERPAPERAVLERAETAGALERAETAGAPAARVATPPVRRWLSPWRAVVLGEVFDPVERQWRSLNTDWQRDRYGDVVSPLYFPAAASTTTAVVFGGNALQVTVECPAVCAKLFSFRALTANKTHPPFSFTQKLLYLGPPEPVTRVDDLPGLPADCSDEILAYHNECLCEHEFVTGTGHCTMADLKQVGYETEFRNEFRDFAKCMKRMRRRAELLVPSLATLTKAESRAQIRLVYWLYCLPSPSSSLSSTTTTTLQTNETVVDEIVAEMEEEKGNDDQGESDQEDQGESDQEDALEETVVTTITARRPESREFYAKECCAQECYAQECYAQECCAQECYYYDGEPTNDELHCGGGAFADRHYFDSLYAIPCEYSISSITAASSVDTAINTYTAGVICASQDVPYVPCEYEEIEASDSDDDLEEDDDTEDDDDTEEDDNQESEQKIDDIIYEAELIAAEVDEIVQRVQRGPQSESQEKFSVQVGSVTCVANLESDDDQQQQESDAESQDETDTESQDESEYESDSYEDGDLSSEEGESSSSSEDPSSSSTSEEEETCGLDHLVTAAFDEVFVEEEYENERRLEEERLAQQRLAALEVYQSSADDCIDNCSGKQLAAEHDEQQFLRLLDNLENGRVDNLSATTIVLNQRATAACCTTAKKEEQKTHAERQQQALFFDACPVYVYDYESSRYEPQPTSYADHTYDAYKGEWYDATLHEFASDDNPDANDYDCEYPPLEEIVIVPNSKVLDSAVPDSAVPDSATSDVDSSSDNRNYQANQYCNLSLCCSAAYSLDDVAVPDTVATHPQQPVVAMMPSSIVASRIAVESSGSTLVDAKEVATTDASYTAADDDNTDFLLANEWAAIAGSECGCTYLAVGQNKPHAALFADWLVKRRGGNVHGDNKPLLSIVDDGSDLSYADSLNAVRDIGRSVDLENCLPVVFVGERASQLPLVNYLRRESEATVVIQVSDGLECALEQLDEHRHRMPVTCLVLSPSTLFGDLRYALKYMAERFVLDDDAADELRESWCGGIRGASLLSSFTEFDALVIPLDPFNAGFDRPTLLKNVYCVDNNEKSDSITTRNNVEGSEQGEECAAQWTKKIN